MITSASNLMALSFAYEFTRGNFHCVVAIITSKCEEFNTACNSLRHMSGRSSGRVHGWRAGRSARQPSGRKARRGMVSAIAKCERAGVAGGSRLGLRASGLRSGLPTCDRWKSRPNQIAWPSATLSEEFGLTCNDDGFFSLFCMPGTNQ